jgi:hypothetical protein
VENWHALAMGKSEERACAATGLRDICDSVCGQLGRERIAVFAPSRVAIILSGACRRMACAPRRAGVWGARDVWVEAMGHFLTWGGGRRWIETEGARGRVRQQARFRCWDTVLERVEMVRMNKALRSRT